jgi:hypothetical protein
MRRIHWVSTMKPSIDSVRRSHRAIRMVSELHKMGCQRLRFMGYQHPNAWRLAVAPAGAFSTQNPAVILEEDLRLCAVHSSAGGGNQYFDWADAASDNARALAEKFLTRFPVLAEDSSGRDWEYAGWLCELLGVLEQGNYLPVCSWEHMKGTPEQLEFVPVWNVEGSNTYNDGSAYVVAALQPHIRRFPLPPSPTT